VISIEHGTVAVQGGLFTGNHAPPGAAINSDSGVTVQGITFAANTASTLRTARR
jgi:hypothetical protein